MMNRFPLLLVLTAAYVSFGSGEKFFFSQCECPTGIFSPEGDQTLEVEDLVANPGLVSCAPDGDFGAPREQGIIIDMKATNENEGAALVTRMPLASIIENETFTQWYSVIQFNLRNRVKENRFTLMKMTVDGEVILELIGRLDFLTTVSTSIDITVEIPGVQVRPPKARTFVPLTRVPNVGIFYTKRTGNRNNLFVCELTGTNPICSPFSLPEPRLSVEGDTIEMAFFEPQGNDTVVADVFSIEISTNQTLAEAIDLKSSGLLDIVLDFVELNPPPSLKGLNESFSVNTNEDQGVEFEIEDAFENDEGVEISFKLSSENGRVTARNGSAQDGFRGFVDFMPDEDFFGEAKFVASLVAESPYRCEFQEIPLRIPVAAVNDAPRALNVEIDVKEIGTTVIKKFMVTDVDFPENDNKFTAGTAKIIIAAAGTVYSDENCKDIVKTGDTLNVTNGVIIFCYDPTGLEEGQLSDVMVVQVADGELTSNEAQIDIDVGGISDKDGEGGGAAIIGAAAGIGGLAVIAVIGFFVYRRLKPNEGTAEL